MREPRNLRKARLLENEKRLLTAFTVLGVTEVVVSFDGSGDSGQIDSTDILGIDKPEEVNITLIGEPRHVFNRELNAWEVTPAKDEVFNLIDGVNSVVYDALELSGVDWYNNDGGYGEWTWSQKDGLELSVHIRIIQTDLEHYESRILGQEEEEEV